MIRVILTDIEGTTSSLSFVHDVLFPYAEEHIGEFIKDGFADNPEIREQLEAVAERSGVSANELDGLIEVLQAWIREDRKETPLKVLQGMLWEQGYQSGAFRGHVYPDAAESLRNWHDRGLRLYVYSSGSVKAQKLIFGHSECGDLTPYFSGYFDTRVGPKRNPESYRNILDQIGVEPETVLFLSDVEAELEAAESVGMRTALLVREGPIPETTRPVMRDFDEVDKLLKKR